MPNNTKQAFWVGLGSIASFGFTMISAMILSRYFNKDDYGTYRQVLYVYNTLLMVFTLGLPKAYSYFLPRIPIEEAKDVINKITRIFLIIGLLLGLVLYFSSSYIALFLNNSNLSIALKWFSPVPLLMLPTMGLEGILATYQKTAILAIYTISTRAVMLIFIALPVILLGENYLFAIKGFVLASVLSFVLSVYFKHLPLKGIKSTYSKTSYRNILKYSRPLMYASFWGVIISSADQFFISRYFGTEVFSDFANGSLELPIITMVTGATATVLMPHFSKIISNKGDIKTEILPIWIRAFEKSAKIIYPILLYSLFFADIIMIIIYGKRYEGASSFFIIKSFVNFFNIIVFAPLILACGKTNFYLNVHMYGALILILLEWISIQIFNSPYIITCVSVICQLGRTFVMLNYIKSMFGVKFIELFPVKTISKILFPSIFILIVIRYLTMSFYKLSYINSIMISLILYITIFSIYVYFSKLDYYSIIKPIVKSKKIIDV